MNTKACKDQVYVKSSFVLRNIVTYLNDNELLPAICFVFSRKNVERYAKELNINLVDNGNEIDIFKSQILTKLDEPLLKTWDISYLFEWGSVKNRIVIAWNEPEWV